MTGYVKAYRSRFDHPLFKSEKLCRLAAWDWLVSHAAFRPTKFNIRGKIVALDRGQMCVTIRQLADAWGWSRGSVDRYMTRLETETMIETKVGTGKTLVTITNYEAYQGEDVKAGTEVETADGTKLGQSWDIKEEDKELKKEKVSMSAKPDADPWDSDQEFKSLWSSWPIKGRSRSSQKQSWAAFKKCRAKHGIDQITRGAGLYIQSEDAQFTQGLHTWLGNERYQSLNEAAPPIPMHRAPTLRELGVAT